MRHEVPPPVSAVEGFEEISPGLFSILNQFLQRTPSKGNEKPKKVALQNPPNNFLREGEYEDSLSIEVGRDRGEGVLQERQEAVRVQSRIWPGASAPVGRVRFAHPLIHTKAIHFSPTGVSASR
jgi:hypothetical protein